MAVPRRRLTVVDRTMLEVWLRDGRRIWATALSLCRSPGTISDEISRHGGVGRYLAEVVQCQAAASRLLFGRKPRLARDGALFGEIARLLRLGWSPEQISGRRKRIEGSIGQVPVLLVSHEAIYAIPRGELRRELISFIRQDKPTRSRKPKNSERRGKLTGMTNIKDRPDEIEDRLVPGHWGGDCLAASSRLWLFDWCVTAGCLWCRPLVTWTWARTFCVAGSRN